MGKARLWLGSILSNFSTYIRTLIPALLKPEDLIYLNKKLYSQDVVISKFASKEYMSKGLTPWEEQLIREVNLKRSKTLVLFSGAGRECIALAKQEYEVTAIDFLPENVEQARKYAHKNQLNITYVLEEVSQMNLPAEKFHSVIAFFCMYGSIPSRKRRRKILREVYNSLLPGGKFIFDILLLPPSSVRKHRLAQRINRALSTICSGNLDYQMGDFLRGNEFHHLFRGEDEFRQEVEETGWEIEKLIKSPHSPLLLGVILKKLPE